MLLSRPLILLCTLFIFSHNAQAKELYKVRLANSIHKLFPNSPEQMQHRLEKYMQEVSRSIEDLKGVHYQERTFDNVALKLDAILHKSNLAIFGKAVNTLNLMHPDENMRKKSDESLSTINKFFVEIMSDKQLYEAFKHCLDNTQRTLSQPEQYYYEQTMANFKRAGLELANDQLEQVKNLQNELFELELTWQNNITNDDTQLIFSLDELEGLDKEFIENLQQTKAGGYLIGMDYPTVYAVFDNAIHSETRKKVCKAFENRAYPANKAILEQLIAKRDALAHLLGYPSFAHYDLENQMVGSPKRARAFLDEVINKGTVKEEQEHLMLIKDLPESVSLTKDNKFYPWDKAFAKRAYEKKYCKLDMNEVAEYFPVERTIQGLLKIYESFLSLRFKEVEAKNLWHEDVRLLEVYQQQNDALLGYVIMDLYPRAGKYSHCCSYYVGPTTYDDDGNPNAPIMWVLTNFPRPSGNKPALLQWNFVRTFFHEFGHALHGLLGRTKIAGQFGHSVKIDFVEMPSQMLEEWLGDKQIVKMLSHHYKTGLAMSDEMLDRLLSLKSMFAGSWATRQASLAKLALDLFGPGAEKDIDALYAQNHLNTRKYTGFDPEGHFYTSFTHLGGYKAKYYSYLWSKVFALDLAYEIKKHGFLDPIIGQKYIDEVIGRGGSANPNELLHNFLGRKPSSDAFFEDMGVKA